jgi:peroxin-6
LPVQQHADAAGIPPQQQQQRQQQQQTGEQPGFVFVVGVVDSLADLPAELAQCFTHHVEAQPLQREEYGQLLHALLEPLQQQQQQQQQGVEADGPSSSSDSVSQGLSATDIAAAASQMVGLLPSDVAGVVADAAAAAAAAAGAVGAAVATGHCSEGGADGKHSADGAKQQQQQQLPRVHGAHLVEALQRVKARTATEIGAPQVPNVTWGDVGGLEDVKAAILDTIELPLKHR